MSARIRPALTTSIFAAGLIAASVSCAQTTQAARRVVVVNMVPAVVSDEDTHDSEPNIGVDASDARKMVGSAFTFNPDNHAVKRAPLYVSRDGGMTWRLNNILPSGSNSIGITKDISVSYATSGGRAYAGILKFGQAFHLNVLRSTDPSSSIGLMDLLYERQSIDQPWVETRTNAAGAAAVDHVYVGNNDRTDRIDDPSDPSRKGKTASIAVAADASALPAPPTDPDAFKQILIESRATNKQDMPAIRTVAHTDGTVYAIFYHRTSGEKPAFDYQCDVMVVRDDHWGADAFKALVSGDAMNPIVGIRVAQAIHLTAFGDVDATDSGLPVASLGSNRLAASNVSIAVDPRNSNVVWIVWAGDHDQQTQYTLHVQRSDDRGVTWSADKLTIPTANPPAGAPAARLLSGATNPALAINESGEVGFLYQQLTNGQWQTHLRISADGTTWEDYMLAETPDPDWPKNHILSDWPYVGDYADLVAVQSAFYGVFSASNALQTAVFPYGVRWQRNVDLKNKQLLGVDGKTVVKPSVDPFFFVVRSQSFVETCIAHPARCERPSFNNGIIRVTCSRVQCTIVEPLPAYCTLSGRCPACSSSGVCPPWYHLALKGIDRSRWDVGLYRRDGTPTDYQLYDIRGGVVLSFKPPSSDFHNESLSQYVVALRSNKAFEGQKLTMRASIAATSRPYRVK